MSTAFILIPAQTDDAPFLLAVYASTRADELALVDWSAEQKQAFTSMQFDAQSRHYAAYYPEAEYFIIQQGGARIGRLIVERKPKTLLLMDIALLPEYRCQGTGTAILRDLMNEACQTHKTVVLHVESFNPARRLYERLGFRAVSENGIYLEMEWRSEEDRDER
ncbi:predicted acetyltransferase [Longilinea arvoryzae]|uniref:Predicted acetyltransferase n=1 Tax=Longilinea arvoryzae TaxID=360412 RepID=A0A0S7BF13_9CHLR|nr:GNAT family N-acetyltransferase [Longilinea arvoryzae]GAP12610.1 predicted acetyltransferase [Longilinea arvoryzae]